jgi:hypothetical protein
MSSCHERRAWFLCGLNTWIRQVQSRTAEIPLWAVVILSSVGSEWATLRSFSHVWSHVCFEISALGKFYATLQGKVKESRNTPGVAQRVTGGLGSQISWHLAHEGGEVVNLTHRPPLPPGMFLVLIFPRGWVDPRAMVRSEGNMSLKNHRESIPGPSD